MIEHVLESKVSFTKTVYTLHFSLQIYQKVTQLKAHQKQRHSYQLSVTSTVDQADSVCSDIPWDAASSATNKTLNLHDLAVTGSVKDVICGLFTC